MTRPTLRDVERVTPSNWGAGGGYRIACDGTCDAYRAGHVGVWGHRYIWYTKKDALREWRAQHPRTNGATK